MFAKAASLIGMSVGYLVLAAGVNSVPRCAREDALVKVGRVVAGAANQRVRSIAVEGVKYVVAVSCTLSGVF